MLANIYFLVTGDVSICEFKLMIEVLSSSFYLFVVRKLARRVKIVFDGLKVNEFLRDRHEILTRKNHFGVSGIWYFEQRMEDL